MNILEISISIEEAANLLEGPDARLYDFGEGMTVTPDPKESTYLECLTFAVWNGKDKNHITEMTLAYDNSAESFKQAVCKAFEIFRSRKTQQCETQDFPAL